MAEIPPVVDLGGGVDLGGIVEAEAADAGLYESTFFLSSTSDFAGYYDEVDAADPFALSDEQIALEKVLIEARLALLAMIKDEEGGVIEEDAAAIAAVVSDDDEASPDSSQVTKVDVLKYCGTTPKRDVKRRYDDPRDVNDEAVIRFKACRGIPIYRVAMDLKHRGPGARGSCMLCKADTNWWCAGCHTWVCHGGGSGSDESANGDSPRARSFIRDVKECIARVAGRTKKQRVVVTAAHSCFVRSHPNFLECVPCASEEDADSP